MTKNTCYFTPHRVWNIDLHNAQNNISGPLDFKNFWEGHAPRPPLEARAFGARIWKPPLKIFLSIRTPLQKPQLRAWFDILHLFGFTLFTSHITTLTQTWHRLANWKADVTFRTQNVFGTFEKRAIINGHDKLKAFPTLEKSVVTFHYVFLKANFGRICHLIFINC